MDPPALINDGVKSMKQVIDKFQTNVIGDMNNVKVYRPGIFKRCYVKEGLPYIKGSEIFLCNPFRRCDHLSRTRTPFIDEMKMKEGQILITCAGSVGDIKLITKEYMDKGAIGSQDIIRLESSNLLYTKEYLFTYLQLPFVYDYIQSMKYGSVIERIEPFHVESIPVVTPTSELSEQITAIIRRYMDCTYRAFITEERAISMVEQEIEKWSD
jgi:restriction endonuclease S subunit